MTFNYRIHGIPCQVEVTGRDWDWAILDRRGRWAPWLERKLTPADRTAILRRIPVEIDEAIASWGPTWEDYR